MARDNIYPVGNFIGRDTIDFVFRYDTGIVPCRCDLRHCTGSVVYLMVTSGIILTLVSQDSVHRPYRLGLLLHRIRRCRSGRFFKICPRFDMIDRDAPHTPGLGEDGNLQL